MADPDSTSRIAPRLRVVVTDGRGRSVRAPGLAAWLARVAPRTARGEVAVALVSDARIRALNKQFRRKDTSTDVLSFPESQSASLNMRGAPPPRALARPSTTLGATLSPSKGRRRGFAGLRSGASLESQARRARVPKLGDIAISTATARRQARAARHSYGVELKVLALHGLLHLLGYDHDHPADRGRMARVERRLRAQGGLHAGLIERS